MHKLRLVWKRSDGDLWEDVELGTCFHTVRPVVGELISYSSDAAGAQGGVWKVVLVYHQPFMERSQKWRSWRERGVEPEGVTDYWVEPAEGPWVG